TDDKINIMVKSGWWWEYRTRLTRGSAMERMNLLQSWAVAFDPQLARPRIAVNGIFDGTIRRVTQSVYRTFGYVELYEKLLDRLTRSRTFPRSLGGVQLELLF
ncbi:MAG: hypothetical protein M1830_000956, partial [Pleopsidium flavum]